MVLLLAQMAAAMLSTAVAQSPTIDEPVYLGAAVVYQQQHSLRYNPEHPPLGKLVMAAGLAFADPRLDAGFVGRQEAWGRHLLYFSGNDPDRLLLAARIPMIVLTLLFGLVVFAFARDVAGVPAGLLALALYTFSPDVVAHGSLATLDVPAAGFLATAVWLLWRARRRPWRYLPLAGAALGAALATRMSVLAVVPVLALLAVLSVRAGAGARATGPEPTAGREQERGPEQAVGPEPAGGQPRTVTPSRSGDQRGAGAAGRPADAVGLLGRGAAAVAVLGVVAVVVVWLSYLAVDPRLRWTPPPDLPTVTGLRALVTDLLPLPRPYRDGMRVQFGFEDGTYDGYLFGELYRGSRWYYLPAALLVKTPLGMLALWLVATVTVAAVPRLRAAAVYLLTPTVVALVAATTGARDFGVRYVVVVPVLLAVVAGTVVTLRQRWAPPAALVAVLAVAASSVATYPYYLPYANEAFGGPRRTFRHLHDSNVDWGQDLKRLGTRLRERYPGEQVWLVYKGSGVPSAYGIRARDPLRVPPDEVRGLLVVSNTSIVKAGAPLRALLRSSRPVDDVGHSITIFRRDG